MDPEIQSFTRGETNWIFIWCIYKIVTLGTEWYKPSRSLDVPWIKNVYQLRYRIMLFFPYSNAGNIKPAIKKQKKIPYAHNSIWGVFYSPFVSI